MLGLFLLAVAAALYISLKLWFDRWVGRHIALGLIKQRPKAVFGTRRQRWAL